MNCALCGLEKPLMKSHIIPRFVTDYLKKTSFKNMKFRNPMANPNHALQDGDKTPLLCHDCEELFSKYEKHFKEGIFDIFHLKGFNIPIQYTSKDYYFIASLLWRTLYLDNREWEKEQKLKFDLKIFLDAEIAMHRFLKGEISSITNMRFEIFLFDEIKQATEDIVELSPHSSIRRSSFGYSFYADETYSVFVNMAGIIAVAIIKDTNGQESWVNCEVKNEFGSITPPQKVRSCVFGIIFEHIKETESNFMSEEQQKKVAEKNKGRFDEFSKD